MEKDPNEQKRGLPMLGSLASTTPLVKVKNIPPRDRADSKNWIEFKVYRDDPNDPFKPHSEAAIHHLAQTPKKKALLAEDELLLQTIGADLDRSLSVEEIISWPIPAKKISEECVNELERLPTWLRSMIEVRYELIYDYFKTDTVRFLRSIANRIDQDYNAEFSNYNGPIYGDVPGQIDKLENKAIAKFGDEVVAADKKGDTKGKAGILLPFRIAGMVAKWKRNKLNDKLWEPHFVHRASAKLRRGLSIKPNATDLAFAADDAAAHAESSDSDTKTEGNHWKKIVREDTIRREAVAELNEEIRAQRAEEKKLQKERRRSELEEKRENLKKQKERRKSDHLEEKENKKQEKETKKADAAAAKLKKVEDKGKKGQKSKAEIDKDKEKIKAEEKAELKTTPSAVTKRKEQPKKMADARENDKKAMKEKKMKEKGQGDGKTKPVKVKAPHRLNRRERFKQLVDRGHFRRYSKLFATGCGDPVDPPKRLEHHYRKDESFHAYIVTIVTSKIFKGVVILVILFNAVVLALETADSLEDNFVLFEVFDEIFLAFYLTEAMLKIYAHPYRYWTSGFNLFDFVILTISLIKSIVDWADVADVSILRVLLIVRALRVLRGISLAVQLQVLVTALVETIKTNILSIVILLVLLVYIAAIVAYYLFGQREGLQATWGTVPQGMLNMISFVTLDGWFDLMVKFEEADLKTGGRIFNLICIVLGNFMFSNIFIAIIIMNISEATDVFRERIQLEKEEIIKRKKDLVFRRQKLDMRQLLARQKRSLTADFFQLAGQFQKLLRHDDLVTMTDICTSPLWMDSCYQSCLRVEHTSNLLLNLHRLMADNLVELYRHYNDGRMPVATLRRGRYNRYMKLKAKLALIKHEIVHMRGAPNTNLRIRYSKGGDPPGEKSADGPRPGSKAEGDARIRSAKSSRSSKASVPSTSRLIT